MRKKQAKKLRKAAFAIGISSQKINPKQAYKELKKIHKSLSHNDKKS